MRAVTISVWIRVRRVILGVRQEAIVQVMGFAQEQSFIDQLGLAILPIFIIWLKILAHSTIRDDFHAMISHATLLQP